MVNRKEEQGQEAIENIKKGSDGKAQIEWTPCDLGCLGEVQKVFTGIRTTEKRLDLVSLTFTDNEYDSCYSQLFLNAGSNTNSYGLDADGIERIFGVNWLGHCYALNLLIHSYVPPRNFLTPQPRASFSKAVRYTDGHQRGFNLTQ